MRVRTLRMGWDVGGWHCDKNRNSRDALVLLECAGEDLKLIGKWRGNLRGLLTASAEGEPIRKMLAVCNLQDCNVFDLTIAIDAPLGWPESMLRLVNGHGSFEVPEHDGSNHYTRRKTEISLINRGYRPLSAVRDMIGSQSTKAMHVLRAAGLQLKSAGVWQSQQGGASVTALETYPAVACKSARLSKRSKTLLADPRLQGACSDIRDALVCALVAHFFAKGVTEEVQREASKLEGWIILPNDIGPSGMVEVAEPEHEDRLWDDSNG